MLKVFSVRVTEIGGGDKSRVKRGADLFNGHQTGIGQFGENQCKFIQQVERCTLHMTLLTLLTLPTLPTLHNTVLASLHCIMQAMCKI